MNLEDWGRKVSLEEFLAIEALSSDRVEYIGGSIFTRKIENTNHARISGNLQSALLRDARERRYDIFAGTAKIITPRGDHIIPDIVVTSDPRDIDDTDPAAEAIIRYPWLVLEITSPQTLDRDTVLKAAAYQGMPEIAYCVTVASDRRMLYVGGRNDKGYFRRSAGDLGDRIVLPAIAESDINIDTIYSRHHSPVDGSDGADSTRLGCLKSDLPSLTPL